MPGPPPKCLAGDHEAQWIIEQAGYAPAHACGEHLGCYIDPRGGPARVTHNRKGFPFNDEWACRAFGIDRRFGQGGEGA